MEHTGDARELDTHQLGRDLFADPSKGKVQLTVGSVQSPTFTTYTEKYEVSPGSSAVKPGDPIPSHLRMGIYHSTSLPGTHVDFTNVQVRG